MTFSVCRKVNLVLKYIMVEKDIKILDIMMERGLIPTNGLFTVNSELIDVFYKIYGEIYPSKGTNRKKSNIKYAKKLAGLSLMKLNLSRSFLDKAVKHTEKPLCGIIYLISNPAFPNMYKIGITQNLDKRLTQYQTGDPFRQYKVEHYKFVEDIRLEEKKYLEQMNINIVNGEWVKSNKVKELFINP